MVNQIKNKSTIMGIDPGTLKCGIGIIQQEKDNLSCIYYETLKASSKLKLSKRLHVIYKQINSVIEKYSPDSIAIEQPFVGANPKSSLAIGQAQAIALISAEKFSKDIYFYSPTEVKKSVTNYGFSSKEQVAEMVKILLNLNELPDSDSADALAISICHIYGETNLLNNIQILDEI